jgi:hypothetical protein
MTAGDANASIDRTIPTDQQGRLNDDAPCAKCGYNLRGLDPLGQCPECGTSIRASVHGELLRYADQHWLARVTAGITWLLIGTLAWLISFGITFLVGGLDLLRGQWSMSLMLSWRGFQIADGLLVGGATAWAGWRIATPEPDIPLKRGLTARRLGRVLLPIAGGAYTLIAVLRVAPAMFAPAPRLLDGLATLLLPLPPIAWILGMIAVLIYLSRLALHTHDKRLGWEARQLPNALIVLLVVQLILLGGGVVMLQFAGYEWLVTTGRVIVIGGFLILGAVSVALYAWLLAVLFRFRRRFQASLRD